MYLINYYGRGSQSKSTLLTMAATEYQTKKLVYMNVLRFIYEYFRTETEKEIIFRLCVDLVM